MNEGSAAQPSGSKLPRHKVRAGHSDGWWAPNRVKMIYQMPVKAGVPAISGYATQPCGSELARDYGSTANITGAEPPLSRASSHMGGV